MNWPAAWPWRTGSTVRASRPASPSRPDLTGITGPQENEKGLEDARRALLADPAPGR